MSGLKSSLLEKTQEQEFQPKEGLSSSDQSLGQLLLSTMSAPTCGVQNAQSHHIVPPPEGHFPALEQSPAGPPQGECVQTSHIISHFTLHFDKESRGWRKQRLVIAMWVYDSESQTDGLTSHHCTRSMRQSEELNTDLPAAKQCLSSMPECLHCDVEHFFQVSCEAFSLLLCSH